MSFWFRCWWSNDNKRNWISSSKHFAEFHSIVSFGWFAAWPRVDCAFWNRRTYLGDEDHCKSLSLWSHNYCLESNMQWKVQFKKRPKTLFFTQFYHICRSFVSWRPSGPRIHVSLPSLRAMTVTHFRYRVQVLSFDQQSQENHFVLDTMCQL